jgi:glycosyltransferase involved in cell wall biosynthesis
LNGVIDWTGFTQDVDGELAAMDAFVLPSLYGEGLPMVVLEAMAAGVPIVATRVEGTPEAIRDGQDGLIVAPGDPVALAAAIRRIIARQVDVDALRTSALERQTRQFSDRSMAAGVAEVYRRVLSAAG